MSLIAKDNSTDSNNVVVDTTYLEKLLRLSESGVSCDCEFIVGSKNVVIKGHKALFSVASDVFQAMFYGELKEENAVRIEDLDPDGFQGMKQFIYTREVNFTSAIHALLTYIAARKYLVSELITKCSKYIETNLSPSELLEFYEHCKVYNILDFEELCCEMIREKTDEVIGSEYFLLAKADTIEFFLKSPSLKLNSEIEVFSHFERWALAKAYRKKMTAEEMASSFNNLKKHLRFLTITSDEFFSRVDKSLLLNQDEKQAIAFNLLKFGSKPMPENLSIAQENRHIPTTSRPSSYSHTFTLPIENLCSSSLNDTHTIKYRVDRYDLKITISKLYEYIIFDINYWFTTDKISGQDLLTVFTKLQVLAENKISKDLIFENNCKMLINTSRFKIERDRIIFAAIPISELINLCFFRDVDGNKTVTIVGSFDIEKVSGNIA